MADDLSMSPVERALRRAIAEGLFDNLPGTGKPLNWRGQNDANTPRDMQMANKIMKDHDLAPTWMMLGQALADRERKLRDELQRGFTAYEGALQDAERSGDLGRRRRVVQAWERLLATFAEAAERYNRNVLTYNVMVPPGIDRREFINIERELAQLTRRR